MNQVDCKALAAQIKAKVKQQIDDENLNVCLAVVLVGNDPASEIYVRNKEKDCAEVGMKSVVVRLPETTTESQLMIQIAKLNDDPSVTGIIVQLPLPQHIDVNAIMGFVKTTKDADGFTPYSIVDQMVGYSQPQMQMWPCTPSGCMDIITNAFGRTDLSGLDAVVIGRSHIVGIPMAQLLLLHNASVTVCHSHSENTKFYCKNADIIVSAVGKLNLVTADMVAHGACVINVGFVRVDGHLKGDVDYENVKKVAGYVTPIIGSTGLLTRAKLLENTMKLYRLSKGYNR